MRGAGVVGKQPVLEPGESFEYTSGVPLPTPSGFMTGTYGMSSDTGEAFDIEIPTFSLDSPERDARSIESCRDRDGVRSAPRLGSNT